MRIREIGFGIILALSSLLIGCRFYKVTVEQGNLIDSQLLAKVRVGMNKDEVNAALGSPILENTFDQDSWSYVYTQQVNGGPIQQQRLELRFKNDRLSEIKR